MEFMISGRNLTVSDRFREYAGEKISKIESLGGIRSSGLTPRFPRKPIPGRRLANSPLK